eukprot:Nitzschia sp. Nitz4//scaffold251_size28233//6652//7595//NITZ4_008131-RA/size28233-augustus-gene-0.16-mRNA-1//-1//CDS//3329544235//4828//frame0
MSKEELEAAHKKALKALDGEKRAAIKKAKSTKGKKAKEALAAVEADFAAKLQALEGKHKEDMASLESQGNDVSDPTAAAGTVETVDKEPQDGKESTEMSERERKLEKARRKKERQKEKELEKQRLLEEEQANAGPGLGAIELGQISAILEPLQLQIKEVEADGHCLYRAIAAQANGNYSVMRDMCASALVEHQDDFAPFCELTDTIPTFEAYVSRVRSSADWGGHLELRALSIALQRPIQVYSVSSGSTPLTISHESVESIHPDAEPIRLSYHLHYYALGEHYNQVVGL